MIKESDAIKRQMGENDLNDLFLRSFIVFLWVIHAIKINGDLEKEKKQDFSLSFVNLSGEIKFFLNILMWICFYLISWM